VDATLKGLLGLIRGTDVEVRCAALLALTHLEAAEDQVVDAVGNALSSPNVVVRDFAIGYFERVRPCDGVAFLLPLLDAQEDVVRTRVVSILEHYGAAAVSGAKKLLTDAPRRRVNAIIDLCARVRTSAALDVLFGLMAADDLSLNRAACDALVAAVPALDARARADLLTRAESFAAGAKGHRTIFVAAARILGALADARARKLLFAMLDEREPPVVRTHALGALTPCLREKELSAAEVGRCACPLRVRSSETFFTRPTSPTPTWGYSADRRHCRTTLSESRLSVSLVTRRRIDLLAARPPRNGTTTGTGFVHRLRSR
jgi:hypothetical protein